MTQLEANGNAENLPTLIIPCSKRLQKLEMEKKLRKALS